jgi:hypothetical protein
MLFEIIEAGRVHLAKIEILIVKFRLGPIVWWNAPIPGNSPQKLDHFG